MTEHNNEYLAQLNHYLESVDIPNVDEINGLLYSLGNEEQLRMHGVLSSRAISKLYAHFDNVTIEEGAKEHVIYAYYNNLLSSSTGSLGTIVEQVLADYKKYKFVAIESIIIQLLQQAELSEDQVARIGAETDSKQIAKYITESKSYMKLQKKELFAITELQTLMELRLYPLVQAIIRNNAAALDDLKQLCAPQEGEKDRKHKLAIYEMAQNKPQEQK